jgi:hypothetical protein
MQFKMPRLQPVEGLPGAVAWGFPGVGWHETNHVDGRVMLAVILHDLLEVFDKLPSATSFSA